MKIVQAVKKLNSISRDRLNFRRRPILCTCTEIVNKRAALVAYFTNFSFEVFLYNFDTRCPFTFSIHGEKSQKWPKNWNQEGGGGGTTKDDENNLKDPALINLCVCLRCKACPPSKITWLHGHNMHKMEMRCPSSSFPLHSHHTSSQSICQQQWRNV